MKFCFVTHHWPGELDWEDDSYIGYLSFRFETMPTMPTRQLGKNGPQVSAIGFGVMGLSPYGTEPGSDEERFKILDRAIKLGCTYFDSADIYGDNEDLLGRYFKKYPEKREKVSTTNQRSLSLCRLNK